MFKSILNPMLYLIKKSKLNAMELERELEQNNWLKER